MFKVGDRVKVIRYGWGCDYDDLGAEVTITAIGRYCDETGYRVTPAIGNTKSGFADGYIGGESFELIQDDSKYHKHHDLIIAWAKGAEIELRAHPSAKWLSTTEPRWYASFEYRIKPKPTARDKRIAKIESDMRKLADELKDLRDE